MPFGFNQLPIFNRIEVSMGDDLDFTGCKYVLEVADGRFSAESTYANYT